MGTRGGPPERLSLRAFARRIQVGEGVVRKAIRSGRLERAVRRIHGRPVIIDVALAEREWRENQDPAKGRSASRPSRGGTVAAARRRVLDLQAAKLEQALAIQRQTLVSADEVERRVSQHVIRARNHLLGLSAKAKQRLPHLSAADLMELESLVREALEELEGLLAGAVPIR